MDYLFKISLENKSKSYFSNPVKPLYYVCRDKDSARKFAESRIKDIYEVRSISKLAVRLANDVFSGSF